MRRVTPLLALRLVLRDLHDGIHMAKDLWAWAPERARQGDEHHPTYASDGS